MTILVTGCAGFIGFHVCQQLLNAGTKVVGVDVLNEYYDVKLKHARLDQLKQHTHFQFIQADIADYKTLDEVMRTQHIDTIVNLAAQAGVRYAVENPQSYIHSN